MVHLLNEKYFDEIDCEEKAYWIGFIWCDGYINKRERIWMKTGKERIEYNTVIALQREDRKHLEKLVLDLDSNYSVKDYNANIKKNTHLVSRLFITNTHMGKTLQNKYGIVPRREDPSILISYIPEILKKHFIRGCFDADGSINKYLNVDKSGKRNDNIKYAISFTTNEILLEFIEQYFYKNNLTSTEYYKKYWRHKEENRDGSCRSLTFSGRVQAINILKFLYNDSNIYLNRKYLKFKELEND